MKKGSIISIALTIIFLFAISINNSQAKWKDESGDLPGMGNDGGTTTALIAGGVIITGLIVYLIIRKGNLKKSSSSIKNNYGNVSDLFAEINKTETPYNQIQKASEQSHIQLFTSNNSFQNPQIYNNQSICIGLRFKF